MGGSSSDRSVATQNSLTMLWQAMGPILVGLVVGFAFWLTAPDHASPEFYSTASQIIPVLMLALIIEGRVFATALGSPLPPPKRPFGRIGRRLDPYTVPILVGLVVALIGIGELSALGTVGDARYRTTDPSPIYFVLGFGFGAVAAIPLWRLPKVRPDTQPEQDRAGA